MPLSCKVAVADFLGAKVAVVLVDADLIAPATGDRLIAKVQSHYPTMGVVLVAAKGDEILSYAQFESQRIAVAAGDQDLLWRDVDISAPPPDDDELPF